MSKKQGEFSVCQFFPDGSYEYVRRWVDAEEAVKAFRHYTENPAARILKITQRVILTDGGDCVNMEWVQGKGITFPPEAMKYDPPEGVAVVDLQDPEQLHNTIAEALGEPVAKKPQEG